MKGRAETSRLRTGRLHPYHRAVIEEELLEVAEDAARSAGRLLLDRFHGPARGVGAKSTPTDLVSDADRDAERLILDRLERDRPGDGVLAEEGGGRRSRSGFTWIVDPLDGTVNFLFGISAWGVSIAVEDRDGAVVGVVHHPAPDETFTAMRGRGAFLNGDPITVSGRDDLGTALVGTGFAYDARARVEQADLFRRVLPRVRDIRRAGSAALDLAATACGRLDAFYEAPMERWDRAAGMLLIQEAGGVVTDLAAPIGLSSGVIAANPVLHAKLESLVKEG